MVNYNNFEKKYSDMIYNLINEDPNKKSVPGSISDLLQNDWKLPEYKMTDEFPIAQTRPVIIPITGCGKSWAPFTWNIKDIIGVDNEETAIKKSFISKINGIL